MLHRQKAEQICLLLTGATWSFPLRHWATCFTPSFKEHNHRKSCLVYFLTLDILGAVTDLLHAGADRKHPGQDFFQHLASVSAQIVRGGDDRQIWLLSAAKWMEVKVQSGSHGVILSGRWEDKHILKGGDERETDEGELRWWGKKKGCVRKPTEPWRDTSA